VHLSSYSQRNKNKNKKTKKTKKQKRPELISQPVLTTTNTSPLAFREKIFFSCKNKNQTTKLYSLITLLKRLRKLIEKHC